jgi:hypothetical protein
MQIILLTIISALTYRKPYLLGNRSQETVPGNRRETTVQKTVGGNRREGTVQPTVRLVIDLETGTVKSKLEVKAEL